MIEIKIIEGRLTDVELSGNERLRDSYIRKRLLLNSDQPLNLETLQEDIQLLQQNRLIDRVYRRTGTGSAARRRPVARTCRGKPAL